MYACQDGTVNTESFWVSVYKQGCKTVHGKVVVRPSLEEDNQVELEAQDGITFERLHGSSVGVGRPDIRKLTTTSPQTSFQVSCPTLKVENTLLRLPKQVARDVLPKGVCSRFI